MIGNGSTAFNSSSASAQTALLYPGPAVTGTNPNYSAWAGDQADSEPSYQDSNGDAVYGSDVATSFQALSNTTGTITLPVYPLTLSLTLKSDAGTVTKLTAVDAGGGDTMTLNGTSGTVCDGASPRSVPDPGDGERFEPRRQRDLFTYHSGLRLDAADGLLRVLELPRPHRAARPRLRPWG